MKRCLLIILIFSTCASQQNIKSENQGINGRVLWLEGDFMPGPGQINKGKPIAKELYFFAVINAGELDGTGPFYSLKRFSPIKMIKSDENGLFSVELPTGVYSVFSKEPEGYFANIQDGIGNINPVEVVEGEFTTITLEINYKAVY